MQSFKREMAADVTAARRPGAASPQTKMPPPASTASSSSSCSDKSSECARPQGKAHDSYFRFTERHETLLLAQARRQASALVVDALYDPAKWRLLREYRATSTIHGTASNSEDASLPKHVTPAQRNLQVYELKPRALDRVACVAPKLASDPQQLAMRSHTLLAKTRVRGKLDDFMGWMSTKKRAVFQGMAHTLHDGHLHHCDVFTGFEAENPQQPQELEQFAIKYAVIDPTSASNEALRAATVLPPTQNGIPSPVGGSIPVSPALAASTLGATKRPFGFLRRKGPSDVHDPGQHRYEQSMYQQRQPLQPQGQSKSAKTTEDRVQLIVGEYSTIRQAVPRPYAQESSLDSRIGIISFHSIEDPELLQLCNSVAHQTTPRQINQGTARTQLQYSGLVVYPVAAESTDDTAEYLEVVIKMSFFDARGLAPQKRATLLNYIAGFRNLAHMMLVMRLRASPFLTATHWVADQRRKCCLVCQLRFSSLRRRHHCRLCGEVTCSRCSSVHQVRLVKEAKASLRICLLCVQGVERPKWKELVLDEEIAEQQHMEHMKAGQSAEEAPKATDTVEEEDEEPESDRSYLLDFSLIKEVTKERAPSPMSTATDTSSPTDPSLQTSGTPEPETNPLAFSIRDFHDSAYDFTFRPTKSKRKKMVLYDATTLEEAESENDDDDEDDEDDEENNFEPQPEDDVVLCAPLEELELANAEEVEEGDDQLYVPAIRRLTDSDTTDEAEEDERLQCLAAYGLMDADTLSMGGLIPEDLALQTIVKEAAHHMDSAIAAISFIDASRDMVCATYSASPLCQVPRGVLPKQHSLSWEIMKRTKEQPRRVGDDIPSVVVNDATKDQVLKSNAFVIDSPFARFMIGIPLRSWTGVAVGALVVADIQPRSEVSADDIMTLRSHVAVVESWLENRRQERLLKAAQARGVKTSNSLEDRLAEMLTTSYKTTLELEKMRGMQMKQPTTPSMGQP